MKRKEAVKATRAVKYNAFDRRSKESFFIIGKIGRIQNKHPSLAIVPDHILSKSMVY